MNSRDYEAPEELPEVEKSDVPQVSGGVRAVVSALNELRRRTGVVDGMIELARMNQTDGFDCPGCAWPDPEARSPIAEYCENGAKAFASEATRKRVTPSFFARHSVADLAARSDFWLNDQGRLTHPMVLRDGARHYEPISWGAAFQMIGKALNGLGSPDEAVFYTSGRTSNEAAFLYQLFVRAYGTNNLPDCSNMCHESSGTGLKEVIGVGKGTVTLADFDEADTIVVVGQNPGTNHPRMLSTLRSAKKRGARIVHINPLPEVGLARFKHPQKPVDLVRGGTTLADEFLQVRINGDVALLQGVAKALLEMEDATPGSALDMDFIRSRTANFATFKSDVRGTAWQAIERASGVHPDALRRVASLVAAPRRTIVCWAMGLTQHQNAVANIHACVNLLLLTGSIGKPGAGACPVRGHSNVQGDRTMGIWDNPPASFLDALDATIGFKSPRNPGYDTVAAIHAMHSGAARVFFALGGNFLSASPDTAYTAAALRSCELTVQVSTTLNRSHLITGRTALILPCLGRTEQDLQQGRPQFVTVENSMGVVHPSEGRRPPASPHLLSEPAIIAGLAAVTLGADSPIRWAEVAADYGRVRDLIAQVIPGFAGFNARLSEDGHLVLPNPARDGRFETSTGKAHFTVTRLPDHKLAADEYMMMTIRSHDQFNTTVYGLDDRYRGLRGRRRIVLMNREDMGREGLREGQHVDLTSTYDGDVRSASGFVVTGYDIPTRCVATYFPEANLLVPIDHKAERSNTPASKSVPIRLHPLAGDVEDSSHGG